MHPDTVVMDAERPGIASVGDPELGPEPVPDVEDGSKVRWDALYGAVLLSAVLLIVSSPFPVTPRIIAVAALLTMVPWYIVFIRPHFFPCGSGKLSSLAVVLVLFAVAQSQNPYTWFLAFGLCPLAFHVVPFRSAMTIAVSANVIAGALTLPRMTGELTQAMMPVAFAGFGIVMSIGYGSWFQQIMRQSAERAALIARLAATRSDLAEVSHAAGVLAERQRLASDIHDTLAQAFTSLVMLTEAIDLDAGDIPVGIRRQLRLIARTARDGLTEARALVTALTPPQLRQGNLDDVLRELTERIGAELMLCARFETVGPARPLPADIEVVMLRVGQEALANVRKHAKASEVEVRLSYDAEAVRLEVADNGIGFDPVAVNGGFGLRGMRDRLKDVAGQVGVASSPGGGTTIRATVPA